jgi:hypothetical protein
VTWCFSLGYFPQAAVSAAMRTVAQAAPGILDLDHLDKADAVMENQPLVLFTLKWNPYESC